MSCRFHMPSAHCLTVVAVAVCVGVAGARGQASGAQDQLPYIGNSPDSAQSIARRSLDALRRGEDATSDAEKRAAYDEGLRLAEQALQLDDNNADAHFARFANKGRLLLLEGATANPINLLKVNRELERALEINPNHADALAAKGGLYRQLPRLLGGSESKAEQYLTRAISLEPERAVSARIELARLYQSRGEPERVVELLHKAIAIAERDGKKRQLGEARELLKEVTGAASAQ